MSNLKMDELKNRYRKYTPVINEMYESQKQYEKDLSTGTNAFFVKNDGIKYIDKTTRKEISPSEYEKRYYAFIKKTPNKRGGVKTRKNKRLRKSKAKKTCRKTRHEK